MVKANVGSYRDLPKLLYQIHTKFRDEPRPRGGLIRVREFDMKDAYSFDEDHDGLSNSYERMIKAYKAIYERTGIDVVQVEADSGAIGGKDSHEFMLLVDSGEDTVVLCDACDYAANTEKLRRSKQFSIGLKTKLLLSQFEATWKSMRSSLPELREALR